MNQPAEYATVNYIAHHVISDFSDEFSDEINKMSGRCLDIGSGPGDVVVDIVLPKLDKEASLVCSDISEKMIEYGKEKYKDNGRVSFIKLDIESPDLANDLVEQFDHVTSFYCLHWCQDMRLVFENIFNLLKPGGTAFFSFIAKFPGLNAYKKLAAMPRYQPYMKDADRYIPVFQHSEHPRRTLTALIQDVGFDVHHCSVREKNHVFDNSDTFKNLLVAVNPFVDRIPTDLIEEFKNDLVKEVSKQLIVFNKKNNNENEYNVLSTYQLFIAHLTKPLTN